MRESANCTAVLALSVQAEAVAKTKIKSVQNVADVLATMMQDIHGGRWKAFCDHETEFVLVRSMTENGPIAKPERGEAA